MLITWWEIYICMGDLSLHPDNIKLHQQDLEKHLLFFFFLRPIFLLQPENHSFKHTSTLVLALLTKAYPYWLYRDKLRLWVSLQAIWLIFNTFSCLCCQLSTFCHGILCGHCMFRDDEGWTGEYVVINVLTVFPALNRWESVLGGLMTHFFITETCRGLIYFDSRCVCVWGGSDLSCPEQLTLTSPIHSPQGL